MLHLPCQMLEARPLSESIMSSKHAYSDSFLRKILVRSKVIVSVGVTLNAIRPIYFVACYLSRRGYTIIPVNPRYEGELLFGQRVYARSDQIEQPMIWYRFFKNRMRCLRFMKMRWPAALKWCRVYALKWSTEG